MYQYKVRLIPTNIAVRKGNLPQVMPQLETFLNSECQGGWEYYRTDSLNLIENAGCLGSMFGASNTFIPVVLFVFRKSVEAGTHEFHSVQTIAEEANSGPKVAYFQRSGARIGVVNRLDDTYVYVVKETGKEEKFLLTSVIFQDE